MTSILILIGREKELFVADMSNNSENTAKIVFNSRLLILGSTSFISSEIIRHIIHVI